MPLFPIDFHLAACVEFAYKFFTRLNEGQKMNAWVKEVQAVTRNRLGWRDDPLDGSRGRALCMMTVPSGNFSREAARPASAYR